jgi:alanyl aminopeptidase
MCLRNVWCIWIIGLFVVSAGCTGPQTRDDKSAAEADGEGTVELETDWDGHDRLDETVRPDNYELDLSIDPEQETLEGRATVEVTVDEPVERIHMHAEKLDFEEVEATRDGEGREVRSQKVEHGGLVLAFDQQIEPGPLTLKFVYDAPMGEVPEGIYRVKADGEWYVYSQFQPLEARSAFPSFDEPGFKTPFDLTLRVPEGMTAATTTPMVEKRPGDSEGMVVWEFAETKPLPTYLTAFAVGNFDVVEAPAEAMGDVRLRVLTPQGKGDLAEFALEKTPPLVEYQRKYFGREFPYEKLDLVAVPNFGAAAMENVGLVTYRESLLLLDPEQASAGDRYWAAAVMAHEYAHMWFGNMVTLEWWDDLWLNEAFATWMGTKTLHNVFPEYEASIESVDRALGVMKEDSLASAHAIRQPIEHGGDVYNAFSGITYQKGRAVLDMVEGWLGEETFREGVRNYLDANVHGTATTEKLLDSLGEASGKAVRQVTGQFLDQPGVPLVTVNYDRQDCAESGTPELELEQTRYRPAGSDIEVGEPWQIPMCVRYGHGDGEPVEECFVFEGSGEEPRKQTVELDADTCPGWIHPNADESGYYHWKLAPVGQNTGLLEHLEALSLRERIALLPHFQALVRAGSIEVGNYLEAMEAMAGDERHRLVIEHIIGSLRMYVDLVYEGRPSDAFSAFASRLIEPHYRRVGYESSSEDSEGTRLLRPTLVRAAADLAKDESVIERATEQVRTFLEDPEAETGPTIKFALDIAARHGGKELWKALRENLDEAPSPGLRAQMIGALGQFRDAELAGRSLDVFLTDAVRAQNFWRLMGPVSGDPATQKVAWQWMTEHYGEVAEKIGQARAGRLPAVGNGFCSEAGKQKLEEFFSKEEHRTVTTERNLEQTLQSIDQCMAHREEVADGVRSFVEGN